jgi:CDP-diacylglycerol---serine O-phosphatidyltransferase
MANCITKYIPNTLTCCNLFSGAIATVQALNGNYTLAFLFIIAGAVFDFFDGMAARALDSHSPIGADLDSLADDITFGIAPASMLFAVLRDMNYPDYLKQIGVYFPYIAFILAVFSALRLAKFNIDARQTSSFIGLPVPANALFWGSLIASENSFFETAPSFYVIVLTILAFIFSFLLVAEIPMFSLKFKDLKWGNNKIRFIFLIICIPLIIILKELSLAAIVIWYIILSVLTEKETKKVNRH